MTRTLSLAAMFAVVAGVSPATTSSQAAGWPMPSLASGSGVILTQGAGQQAPKCEKGMVYDKKKKECVPAKK